MRQIAFFPLFFCTWMIGASVLAPGPAAHGVYDWIRQKDYRAVDGRPCCGIDDCFRIDPKNVSIKDDAYLVTEPDWSVTVSISRALPSDDRYFWICLDTFGVRCFFAPPVEV